VRHRKSEVYDVKRQSWRDLPLPPSTNFEVGGFGFARIDDETVLIVGGSRHGVAYMKTTVLFNMKTETWTQVESVFSRN